MGSPAGCHVAGGWVRDRLLGLDTVDIDVAVETSVEQAGALADRLARRHSVRAHLLGRRPRAVWRVDTPSARVEVWPLGDLDLEGDARRRDFTCNAMLWSLPDGPLYDPTGGREDLEHDRLRAVSRDNLADDPVRLLRGIRFLAQLAELELDADTGTWIRDLAGRLRDAPRQRLGHEIARTMAGPGVASALATGAELGVWRPVAPPTAADPDRLATDAEAASRLSVADRHPVPAAVRAAGDAARLALVAAAWRPADDADLAPYGWPRADREAASTVAAELDEAVRAVDAPAADRREMIATFGSATPVLIAVAAAMQPRRPWRRWWDQWRRSGERLMGVRPLLTADEVARRIGLRPGPELGRVLAGLVRAQVRGEVRSVDGARRWLRSRMS
jgi:tRNA nucleotidyltransferase/poly(A) polymerase